MSDSVTKMSEMCQMMMRNEMATMPYKVATGITIVALVLLIVLEIQWIKYWSRILKRQENSPANCG
jgi:hypothetical protein